EPFRQGPAEQLHRGGDRVRAEHRGVLDGRLRLEKKTFPGSEVVFWIYVATMMVPGQVTLIPLYGIMRDLGLLNTHIALALPVVNAFGVFLIRQFMKGIPDDLLDATRIDGASDFRIFVRIILPLVKPVIIALTVFTFLTTWN